MNVRVGEPAQANGAINDKIKSVLNILGSLIGLKNAVKVVHRPYKKLTKSVHCHILKTMKSWAWKPEKNDFLKKMGRPCFEDVLEALTNGGFRDVLTNPNYPDQKILIVIIDGYAHAVPFKETKGLFLLFTVFPSWAYQKRYGGKK